MLSRNLVPLEHVFISSMASSNIINFGPLEDEHRGHWNSQTFCLGIDFVAIGLLVQWLWTAWKSTPFFIGVSLHSPCRLSRCPPGQEVPGVPRIQKMPASGISSELSAHQMARSEIRARQWHFIRAERSSNFLCAAVPGYSLSSHGSLSSCPTVGSLQPLGMAPQTGQRDYAVVWLYHVVSLLLGALRWPVLEVRVCVQPRCLRG